MARTGGVSIHKLKPTGGVSIHKLKPTDHPFSRRYFKWKTHYLECLKTRLTHLCDLCENVELRKIDQTSGDLLQNPINPTQSFACPTVFEPWGRVTLSKQENNRNPFNTSSRKKLSPPDCCELTRFNRRSLSTPPKPFNWKSMLRVSRPGSLVSTSVWIVFLLSLVMMWSTAEGVINTGNPDAKRLYDDLLSNYNKLVRPVQNTTDPLTVRIKLKLSQLIDVVSL